MKLKSRCLESNDQRMGQLDVNSLPITYHGLLLRPKTLRHLRDLCHCQVVSI